MFTHESLNLLRGYLDAQQYGAAAHDARARQPFVTVSRETGAGGLSIAALIRENLQAADGPKSQPWLLIDRDLLAKVAERHNLPQHVAQTMDQDHYDRLLKWMDELIGKYPSWSEVVRKCNETMLCLARMGHVILVGRGAHALTRRLDSGVHVRLIAALPDRVDHVMAIYKLTRREAERFIGREEAARAMYVQDHFRENVSDPHGYDLTINTDRITYAEAAALVCARVAQVRARLAGAPAPAAADA